MSLRFRRAGVGMVVAAVAGGCGHNYPALPVQRLCNQAVSVEVFHEVNDLQRTPVVTVQAGPQFLLLFDRSCKGAVVAPNPDRVFESGGAQIQRNGYLIAGLYVTRTPQVVQFQVAPIGGHP